MDRLTPFHFYKKNNKKDGPIPFHLSDNEPNMRKKDGLIPFQFLKNVYKKRKRMD